MLKIENTEVVGWENAIRGMRNPMNSWSRSDSEFTLWDDTDFEIGENDLKLMKSLASGGSDDRKYLRMIVVYADIIAPIYWWKEYDTYKVGTVANSCSTMHKIHAKEFVLDDFSIEHLTDGSIDAMNELLYHLNFYRELYLTEKDKQWWWQMIQLLPTSYNQRRTAMLNYEVLKNMYHARRYHKLDEWHTFCDWVKTLPYSELITGEEQ